jgi:hypothetical protein
MNMITKTYRMLDWEEIVSEGDEFRAQWQDPDDWCPCTEFIGCQVAQFAPLVEFRRPTLAPQTSAR